MSQQGALHCIRFEQVAMAANRKCSDPLSPGQFCLLILGREGSGSFHFAGFTVWVQPNYPRSLETQIVVGGRGGDGDGRSSDDDGGSSGDDGGSSGGGC